MRRCHKGDGSLTPHSSTILPSTTRWMSMFSIVLRVPLGANPSNSSRSWVPLPMVRVTTLSPSVICSSMLKWRSQLPPLGEAERIRGYRRTRK
jgi:hypothetical protein